MCVFVWMLNRSVTRPVRWDICCVNIERYVRDTLTHRPMRCVLCGRPRLTHRPMRCVLCGRPSRPHCASGLPCFIQTQGLGHWNVQGWRKSMGRSKGVWGWKKMLNCAANITKILHIFYQIDVLKRFFTAVKTTTYTTNFMRPTNIQHCQFVICCCVSTVIRIFICSEQTESRITKLICCQYCKSATAAACIIHTSLADTQIHEALRT